ncbi:hypothetical protein [Methanobrevibacter millerae]|uniref:Uncharacterized protein n=1 Tax=Methanobrevibacter millerae TaxID=230361 RepID=A0A1G5VW10_9EURY|nr:hypothetical protein [Methanobrevibacter millerae]SDA49195.1 hypothetical protein SAMN02910315_00896 [Methanobrevibacter millerae]
MNYSLGSILRGIVIQHYCKNCDKTVSVYRTGPSASIFSKEGCIDFLKDYLPKKQEKMLKTSVIFYNLVELVESYASLKVLNNYLENHDEDIYYKIDFNDYLSEKSFESMDFNINDYVKEKSSETFRSEDYNPYDLFNGDLNNLDSDNLDLKSLQNDLSNHLNELSANNLNRDKFYFDISQRFRNLSEEIMKFEKEILCINYQGDDFNITLDGEKIDEGVCPQCGEEFYVISPDNPCPQCGKNEIEFNRVFFD